MKIHTRTLTFTSACTYSNADTYSCIHTCTCTKIVHTHTHIHTYFLHVHTYTHTQFTNTYKQAYACTDIHACANAQTRSCTHRQSHGHIHTCSYTKPCLRPIVCTLRCPHIHTCILTSKHIGL